MEFKPGFRISKVDITIIILGIVGALIASRFVLYLGLIVIYVVGHFLLYCNVFRVSRPPELIWAFLFVMLSGLTILLGKPGWTVTVVCSILSTIVILLIEIRRPSYHGILWERLNPNLKNWWAENVANAEHG